MPQGLKLSWLQELPTFGGNAAFFVGDKTLKVLEYCTLVWQQNDLGHVLYLFFSLPGSLIRIHGRTFATNEFLLGILSSIQSFAIKSCNTGAVECFTI